MRFFLSFDLDRRFKIIDISELENLGKYYHEGKLAHAYLLSTNNTSKCMKVLINVIKNIFCVQDYSENCNKCSLCHLIDLGNLPSLKIIEPEGNFIKKDQIINLRDTFSKSSQFTDVNIYIIKNCEKMNKESANTMLKFLEEPEGNVIGFFITKEYNNVLSTIQSRCQHLEVNFENNIIESLNIDEEKYEELLDVAKEYLEKIEIEKKYLIMYNRNYFSEFEKEDVKLLLQIILKIYQDELESRYINSEKTIKIDFLKRFSFNNIKKKTVLLVELLNEIAYNVNIDLLLDRFVIEMDGINNETL